MDLPEDWPRVIGGTGTYTEDFETAGATTQWVDVRQDGYSFPWLYPGNWTIAEATGSGNAWLHDDIRAQPALSFRRYKGDAFGTANGELPARYRASVAVTALASYPAPNAYPPTGDQGIQHYYLDPTHYVELLIKPNVFEVWECNGGQPEKNPGWRRLYYLDTETKAGQTRTLGAEVDTTRGTMKVWLDGRYITEVSSPLIQPVSHWFALRGAGNRVYFDDVFIQSF